MSSLFWAVLDRQQKEKSEELLETFDKGSKDEFGLMTLTIALSNLLYPGTSVLHTRLRYVFLVGWIFKESFGKNYGLEKLHKSEKKLRQILQETKQGTASEDDYLGILGVTKEVKDGEGDQLSQPPFSIYLNLLRSWGIIKNSQVNINELNRDMFDDEYLKIVEHKGFVLDSFVLSEKEKLYIKKKLPNSLLKTLFDQPFLAEEIFIDIDYFNEFIPKDQRMQFHKAYNLSILMWGSMIFYNYFLGTNVELQEKFDDWLESVKEIIEEQKEWKPNDAINLVIDNISESGNAERIKFINEWFTYVSKNYQYMTLHNPPSVGSKKLFDFLKDRESALKGDRARLKKVQSDENYSEPNAKYGINPIEYRWTNVRRFVRDYNASN